MNKICNFYISEKHLNIVLFEYIKKQVKKGIKIVVVSQDSQNPRIGNIRERMKNKKVEKLEDFLDEQTIQNIYNKERITIVVKGNSNFIKKVEDNLTELLKKDNVDILSCYNVLENDVKEISKKYNKILKTDGVHNISKNENLQKI